MKAVVVKEFGGPERLEYVDLPTPAPGQGQALVRITASGVNFIDVYHRMGKYPGALPFVLGNEAAGVVEALGPGATGVAVGERVAYCSERGSYAEYAVVPAHRLVPIPSSVDDRTAAAVLLQGMTAHYLCNTTFPIKAGDTALVHAGAGGVGLLLTQMIAHKGAHVITTVSTQEKAALSRGAGAKRRDPLYRCRFRDRGEAPHRRRWRARGVRLGGQDDV